jgi:exodeoxyribonuclease VII large subunit
VALLRVPVIASVGHHTDRTLIDDVAAVACSTPTHAAEAAVPVDIGAARGALTSHARRLERHGRGAEVERAALLGRARQLQRHGRIAVLQRARSLAQLARAPAEHVGRNRRQLHQLLRELRAVARRTALSAANATETRARGIDRAVERARTAEAGRRRRELERLGLTLAGHDPQRTLARGYAMVTDRAGAPLVSASAARAAAVLELRFADGAVPARVEDEA